ncbi:MAG: gliding motility-associated C-terminal domain-containing protein [Flammeovirgaceae bacterium]|nr:gliding motility-associated C-terminal domain-containing protein [Flammeovirgaceae bacterium]
MKWIWAVGLILFFSSAAYSQYTSRLGRFQINQKKGCAPFTVIITDTNLITTGECTPGKPCLMDYLGNNQQQQNLFSFTYTTPGTYTLSVLYQSIGADDITITVDPNIQPAFDIYTCSASRVSIRITDTNYDQYVIDFNNDGTPELIIPSSNNQVATNNYGVPGNYAISVRGRDLNSADNCSAMVVPFTAINTLPTPAITTLTAMNPSTLQLDFTPQTNILYRLEIATNNSTTFQLYQTFQTLNSITISNLNLDENYYCFRLSAHNPCTNTNTYSIPICSQRFTLDIQSGANHTSWITSNIGVTTFRRTRTSNNQTNIDNFGPGTSSNIDPNVVCKTQYCYTLTAIYSNGGTSTSLEKCGTSFTTTIPTPIDNTSAIVSSTGVDLEWIQDPAFTVSEYSVLRSENNGFFIPQTTTTATNFTDPGYNTEGNFCYRMDYEDVCDNASPEGAPVCPLRLSGLVGGQNIITLNWNGYEGWKNGVNSYRVEKYNQQGTLIGTFSGITDTLFVDDVEDNFQLVSYRVLAFPNEAGVSNSMSNEIKLTKSISLYYPTAFTPNGDNLNDTFTVNGKYIEKLELKIFDRWGSLIFVSSSDQPWDGTSNGVSVQEASYTWTADITDQSGQNIKQSGSVLLLKRN